MGALREQQSGTRMTEVVEADVGQSRPLKQGLEGAVAEVGGVDEGPALRGEDEAAGLVEYRGSGAVCHGAGVRPWRPITSASATGFGGPPVAAMMTAAISRK
jgi:mono/diheme cytochrome c family protein